MPRACRQAQMLAVERPSQHVIITGVALFRITPLVAVVNCRPR
jgi:hypothetical protein